jgi:membrane associated rhomboid family serine protease
VPAGIDAYRRRLCARVPLTTLVTAGLLLGVYLLVQDAVTSWGAPISIPYRAWGYRYATGWLLAPFAHVSPGHLIGNLIGLAVFGTVLEATVGHYPLRRGAVSFRGLRQHPWVRAVIVGPGVLMLVGVGLNLVALGPTIGFSTVVFWLMGVLVVLRPTLAVVGLLLTDAVRVGYLAVAAPRVAVAAQAQFVTPWFAEVALQAHAVGLLVGVLTGLLLRRRGAIASEAPGLHVAAGVVLIGVDRALWAVFFYEGGGTYVLYRAVGVAALLGVSVLIMAAVSGDRRAHAALVGLAVALAAVAVPYNVVPPATVDGPDRSLPVGPYAVSYGEAVPDASVDRIPLEVGPLSTQVTTSGVIVEDPSRGIWITAVGARALAFEQRATIPLAVDGARVDVEVVADRWRVQGNDSVYRVRTTAPTSSSLFESPPSTAGPVIAGEQVTLVASPEGFLVRSAGRTRPLPGVNETVRLGPLRIRAGEDRVVAIGPDARATVFSRPS